MEIRWRTGYARVLDNAKKPQKAGKPPSDRRFSSSKIKLYFLLNFVFLEKWLLFFAK